MTDWNKPDSHAALKPWLLIDPLTLFQAVMLIFGRDPSHSLTGRPHGYVPIITALRQAIGRGEVPALLTRDTLNGGFLSLNDEDHAFVKQDDIRQWLTTINYTDAFFFLTPPSEWTNSQEITAKISNHDDKPLPPRAELTYLNIIGGLLELMLGKTPSGKSQSAYEDQAAIISALLVHHKGKSGIAKRTLEEKFAAAKRSLGAN